MAVPTTGPAVTSPPESFFDGIKDDDRDAARAFYAKHLDVGGLSIAAAAVVDDAALHRTRDLVGRLLAGRPDVLAAMQKARTRLIIIGRDQVYTDMPEYRRSRDPAYQNERVRCTGGLGVTSFGEENLLNLAIDRYDDERIALHEFCHTVDAAQRIINDGWQARLESTYRRAIDAGRWENAYGAQIPANTSPSAAKATPTAIVAIIGTTPTSRCASNSANTTRTATNSFAPPSACRRGRISASRRCGLSRA